MSPFSKILIVALTALSGVAASAHTTAAGSSFKTRSVIASHEATPTLTKVAHHPRHRHHRGHHARPVRHVR